MKNRSVNYEELIFRIVAAIPRGKVATYGQIAWLSGYPARARMVGRAMAAAPGGNRLPCHRVVNASGRTAPGWERQRALLEKEKVSFKRNGCVDLDRHLWEAVGGPGEY